MAFTDGTAAYEKEASLFEATFEESKTMETLYANECKRRMEFDWLFAFFFGFGRCGMSNDFKYFLLFLNDMYVSLDYDAFDAEGCSESFELRIVRSAMDTLSDLCVQSDEENALESPYLPVKFFMLACLAREGQLVEILLGLTDDGKITERRKTWLMDFFKFIRKDFDFLTQSNFNEFNIRKMMDDFMTRAVYRYQGLLLDEDPSPRSSTLLASSSFPSERKRVETARLAASAHRATTRLAPVIVTSVGGGGLPLPEMYDPKYGSSQTAALSKRAASISYYALVSTLVHFFMNHYYATPLPPGLHYVSAHVAK
jgi:hypothetical protein